MGTSNAWLSDQLVRSSSPLIISSNERRRVLVCTFHITSLDNYSTLELTFGLHRGKTASCTTKLQILISSPNQFSIDPEGRRTGRQTRSKMKYHEEHINAFIPEVYTLVQPAVSRSCSTLAASCPLQRPGRRVETLPRPSNTHKRTSRSRNARGSLIALI